MDPNRVEIKQVSGRWVVKLDGNFFCTCDTFLEAVREVEEYYKE